jgi:hypothetical protein
MDGDKFVEMCKDSLIPAIRGKLSWAKKVEVQMDSAGGHRVNESVNELNRHCARSKK